MIIPTEPSQFKYLSKHVVSTIHRALLSVTLPHYPYEHVVIMTHSGYRTERMTCRLVMIRHELYKKFLLFLLDAAPLLDPLRSLKTPQMQ